MTSRAFRVGFFVQGEGRGHMTQALALKKILEDAGHQVVAAFMGENPARPIPDYFSHRFAAPIHRYLAPVFVVDQANKGVRPWDSFFQALRRFPRYWKQGPLLDREVRACKLDLLVNFYDLIGSLYGAVYRPDIPMVALGHQFLFFHPEFVVPQEERFQVTMIKLNNLLTSLNARVRIGLSFSRLPDLPNHRVRILPPLLRESVLTARPRHGKHILAYVLNPGYSEEIIAWHKTRSDCELHCFWDKKDVPEEYSPADGLTFHQLDDEKFVELLSSCRGFTSTAGFESVCEAAFLGKPICLVPTKKHVEQLCNAMDAERAGVAVWRRDFDLSDFLDYMKDREGMDHDDFASWVRAAPDAYLRLLEGVVAGENPMKTTLAL